MTTSPASLERVTRVGGLQAVAPGAQNRFVVPHADYPAHSPFLVLVEDFIGPEAAGFPMHPHRGFETVTLVLEGQLGSRDHLGSVGVLGPGDVQWMTAGSGIVHAGEPHGGEPVRSLQLWLNLPAALKASPPGTREQRRDAAVIQQSDGATARLYGRPREQPGLPAWSRWPMTLTDLELAPGAEHRLRVGAEDRLFLYVLSGGLAVGQDGRQLVAGEVGWLAPNSGTAENRELRVRTVTGGRVVAYASRPINEPAVSGGPFVMNSEAQINQAFAEYRSGTFLG